MFLAFKKLHLIHILLKYSKFMWRGCYYIPNHIC